MEMVIAVDLAAVVDRDDKRHVVTLAWGDTVDVVGETDKHVLVNATRFEEQPDGSRKPVKVDGQIKRAGRNVVQPRLEAKVLKVDFVDVQQGDGAVIETPEGKVVLIDGGDNQLFARYLASRYRGSSEEHPKCVAAIVVTHGDADHFAGLSEIRASEAHPDPAKRLFLRPERVFHNGLVKRPGRRDVETLGATAPGAERPLITELVDDVRDVPTKKLNKPFRQWQATLEHWATRGDFKVRRLVRGDDDEFKFLRNDDDKEGPEIEVEVLGPIPVTHDGQTGLPFLGEPRRRFGHPSLQPQTAFGRPSASHTINGHSIVLRATYGQWRMLFAGDLNEEAERTLAADHDAGKIDLRSEVFKVPHHGSADFLFDFLRVVSPVVSVVSSGDESPRKEYIHPRATLVSGLGRFGRDKEPVIFVTELVAFFRSEGWVQNAPPAADERRWSDRKTPFYAFSREAFGTVRVRTDGKRLLVYTDSGLSNRKEAYAYTLAPDGTAVPEEIIRL